MNKSVKNDNTCCCVPQCNSRGSRNPELSFHLFPNDKYKISVSSANAGNKALVSRMSEWIRRLGIRKEVSSRMTVCSKHFAPEDFTTTASQRARLKPYAVPTCFLPVLSTDRTSNFEKTAERELRHEEINRKREFNFDVACTSARPDGTVPANDISDNQDESENNTSTSQILDLDKEIAVGALMSLPFSMSSILPSNIKLEKAIQVTSGDLELPYVIQVSKLDDKQLNSLTGLPSVRFLDELTTELSTDVKMTKKHKLPLRERVVLCFMKMKLNISFSCLAIFFGCTIKTASNIFSNLVPNLSGLLECMVEFPPKEKILANLPKCFKNFSDVRIILDCTEIQIEKPKCLNERIFTYSQYKGCHTLKYLIGVSPCGIVTFISRGYGGRASDKQIFEGSGLIEMLEPHIDAVMVDKGYLIDDICERNFINLVRPPFLKQKKQFSTSEAIACRNIARARVHVERTIQRLKIFKVLKYVPYHLFHLMDQVMIIIAAITNLSPPVLEEDKF